MVLYDILWRSFQWYMCTWYPAHGMTTCTRVCQLTRGTAMRIDLQFDHVMTADGFNLDIWRERLIGAGLLRKRRKGNSTTATQQVENEKKELVID